MPEYVKCSDRATGAAVQDIFFYLVIDNILGELNLDDHVKLGKGINFTLPYPELVADTSYNSISGNLSVGFFIFNLIRVIILYI